MHRLFCLQQGFRDTFHTMETAPLSLNDVPNYVRGHGENRNKRS